MKNSLFNIVKNFLSIKKSNVPYYILKNNLNDYYKVLNTHKNNTSIIFFKKKQFFRKYSKSKKGIKKIKAENEGLKWYCRKTKRKSEVVLLNYVQKKKFAYIDLKKIEGKKIKSWDTLSNNYSYLKKFYSHCKKYKLQNSSKIHGDLTFDNIIFNKKKIFIIDWEFFNSKIKFRGYDIVYLFLSAACLPYVIGKKFTDNDEIIFKKLWRMLLKMNLNKKIILDPFTFFKQAIKKDKILNSSAKLSKSKFFPFIVKKEHEKKILQLINSTIKD